METIMKLRCLDIDDLRLMDYFLKGYSQYKTSELMFMSQPAISQRRVKIQESVGHKLFKRPEENRRKLVLSHEGIKFAISCSNALRLLEAGATYELQTEQKT